MRYLKERLDAKLPLKDLTTSLFLVKRLGLVKLKSAVLLAVLTVLVFLTEALGLSLIYPILEYIEAGRDQATLLEKSMVWGYLAHFFGLVGLEISIDLLFLSILFATAARAVLAYINQKVQIKVQLGITTNLRFDYYQATLLAKKSYLETLNTGQILEVYNNLSRAGGGLITAMLRIQHVVVALLVYLFVVLVAEPLVMFFMVGFGIIVSLLTSRYRIAMEKVTSQLVQHNEEISQKVGMTLRIWRSLKFSGARKQSHSSFHQINLKWKELVFDVLIQAAKSQRLLVPVSAAIILSVLYVTTMYLDTSIAFITFFALTFLRVQLLMTALISSRQPLSHNVAKVELFEVYYQEALKGREKPQGKRLYTGIKDGIKFEKVSFRHRKTQKHILKNFSVFVPKGSTVGIFGPSGVGKTTFLDLLARFNLPDSGNVLIDNTNLKIFSLDSLRDDIFYLDQGSTLLDNTVLSSICFGNEEPDKCLVEQALQKTHSLKFVERLEMGSRTFLGEDGAKLSGGQKQRILLSRLFLSNAKIILLDEPTNGLDKHTESLVLKEIKNHQQALSATMFIVSHNPLPEGFVDIEINVLETSD